MRPRLRGGFGAMITVIGPGDGESVQFGGLGVRFMATGEGFSLVEHPIAPRTLAAPMHVHEHEDEYSYVLEGEIGVQIGDAVRYARRRRSRLQAAPRLARVLEPRRRAGARAGDHLPGRLRALLRRGARRSARRCAPEPDIDAVEGTAWSATGCAWTSTRSRRSASARGLPLRRVRVRRHGLRELPPVDALAAEVDAPRALRGRGGARGARRAARGAARRRRRRGRPGVARARAATRRSGRACGACSTRPA